MDSKDNLNNFNEYQQMILFFKSVFDQKLFPSEFDVWNIKEQYTWINDNLTRFFPNVPKSLLHLIPATYRPIDSDGSPMEAPEWLDIDKYRRGQKFVREHYLSIVISTLFGIMHIYSFNDALKPIIISGNSYTPYLAFQRYASTLQRFFSWYNGEPYIKGTSAYRDMQLARRMHSMIQKKLHKLTNEEIDNASKIPEPWCPDRELLLKDFSAACPFEKFGQRPSLMLEKSAFRAKGINNGDMTGIQCSFVALLLIYPESVGVHDATDEDLEAFTHMWKCYGYLLGIDDEYNFCRGSLEEIKQRARDIYQYWIIPNFKDVTPECEHMTRCIVESLNYYLNSITYVTYKVMMLLAMDALNLNMTHLYKSLNYAEWIIYKCWTFLLRHALKFPSIKSIANKVMQHLFERALNFNPEKRAKLHEKSKKQLPDFTITY